MAHCTEAMSIQANVMISGSSAKLIKNGIAPLPFPLPALLKQYRYIQCGERVRVRGNAQFCAKLGVTTMRRKQPDRPTGSLRQATRLMRPGETQSAHFQVPAGRRNKWETACRVQPMMLVVTAALIRCGAASSLYKNVPFAA